MTPDRIAALRAAFDALPEGHRTVLQLARRGHSYAEISEAMGVAQSSVRTWALHGVLALTHARQQITPVS